MRSRLPVVVVALVSLSGLGVPVAQEGVTLPPVVEKRGLTVQIRELARLPDTRGMRPPDQDTNPAGWARVSYVRDLPDGRRFVNDSRGYLYLLGADGKPTVYADFAAVFPFAIYNRLESGFIGFVFHPEFATNGRFYSVHGERATGNPAKPDFIPPGFARHGRDPPQRHHRMADARPQGQHLHRHPARAVARRPHRPEPHPSDGRGRVQPHGQARVARLRPALHQRQRPRLQQRRRPARQQPKRSRSGSIRWSPRSCASTRAAPARAAAPRAWATTPSRPPTRSPATTTRRPWARSTPTASATRTGCRGTPPTARCSPPTSA